MTIEQIIAVLLINTFRHWREMPADRHGNQLCDKHYELAKQELTNVAYADDAVRDGAPLHYYCNECGNEGKVIDLDRNDPRCPYCATANELGILF